MKAVWRTHIGKIRQSNQDSLLVTGSRYPLYAVADGMGGHRGGDVASLMATSGLETCLAQQIPSIPLVETCFEEINRDIYDRQLNETRLSGMGTTLTMLWVADDYIYLGHVGDSRAYLLHEGQLIQKSEDHSLVGDMLRSGLINKTDARSYPYRNIITRSMGTQDSIQCDISVFQKIPGDRWLLCSDGLSEHLDTEEILNYMILADMDEAADRMIVKALEEGGRDNITIILLEIEA